MEVKMRWRWLPLLTLSKLKRTRKMEEVIPKKSLARRNQQPGTTCRPVQASRMKDTLQRVATVVANPWKYGSRTAPTHEIYGKVE
jgi:hypothetical protein